MPDYDKIDISEGIDIKKKQMHQKSVKFVTTSTLKILVLNINYIFAMVFMV